MELNDFDELYDYLTDVVEEEQYKEIKQGIDELLITDDTILLEMICRREYKYNTLRHDIKKYEIYTKMAYYNHLQILEDEGVKSITTRKDMAKEESLPCKLLIESLKEVRDKYEADLYLLKHIIEGG